VYVCTRAGFWVRRRGGNEGGLRDDASGRHWPRHTLLTPRSSLLLLLLIVLVQGWALRKQPSGTYTQIHPSHAKLEREKHLPRDLGRGRGTAKEGLYPTQSTQKRGGGGGGLHGCCVLATCTRARAQKADVTVEKGGGREGWSMSWRWLERRVDYWLGLCLCLETQGCG